MSKSLLNLHQDVVTGLYVQLVKHQLHFVIAVTLTVVHKDVVLPQWFLLHHHLV